MKNIFWIAVLSLSSSAFAASSSCVTYVDGSTTPVNVQYSCDGADLQSLFTASGMTAAMSKTIPHFLDKGYSLANCTDSYSAPDVNNGISSGGTAYSRCIFIKK